MVIASPTQRKPMKLRKLHIDDYKMFKDFDISFVDENDKALPIVVLAGVNGSGKTTLLEFIYTNHSLEDNAENSMTLLINKEIIDVHNKKKARKYTGYTGDEDFDKIIFRYNKKIENYHTNIIYIPVYQNNIHSLKDVIIQKYIDRAFAMDKPSKALAELQDYIAKIFNGLKLTFNLSRIDYNKKEVLFKDKNGIEFDIDKLSTGEKTLLSKVLYLYFEGYKDKVILIDEPELSLHPSWQNRVLKIYENFAIKNNCQIIIATHSPHIIGSAKPEYLRVLKKVEDKIEVMQYTQSYGLEFNKILTDIMGAETRVSDVSEQLSKIKSIIIQNDFDSDEFKEIWSDLENLIGADNIDLRLLKLEIASRKKNVSNK